MTRCHHFGSRSFTLLILFPPFLLAVVPSQLLLFQQTTFAKMASWELSSSLTLANSRRAESPPGTSPQLIQGATLQWPYQGMVHHIYHYLSPAVPCRQVRGLICPPPSATAMPAGPRVDCPPWNFPSVCNLGHLHPPHSPPILNPYPTTGPGGGGVCCYSEPRF